jgi:hypothetical protein
VTGRDFGAGGATASAEVRAEADDHHQQTKRNL